ncbi:hypothetical protein [Halalkalibacter alkalisediminis]|uniref:Uncharacterized protein n=1 Tax=Halalkalibacter alkalisediminis TaxID=935616 RepID=A0ABV6NNJ0_9BACI|nr:hypothetical protein [Halalkalibacter alkalisediminis]
MLYIRENKSKSVPTTEELAGKIFAGKLDVTMVGDLLKENEEIGLIKGNI